MKKLVFLILVVVVSAMGTGQVYAEFEAGTKSLGGTVYFQGTRAHSESPSHYSYLMAPNFSYFPWKNVSLDISFQYGSSWLSGSEDTGARLGLGLGGRYFYKNVYAGAAFLYSYSRSNHSEPDVLIFKRSSKELRLSAGYLIGIAENIFLDVGIAYTRGIGKVKNTVTGDTGDRTLPNPIYDNEASILQTSVGISLFFK